MQNLAFPLPRCAMRLRFRCVYVLVFLLTACSDPTGAGRGQPGPGRGLALTGVEGMTPGETATLRGRSLMSVSSLTVDGQPVDLAPGSDTLRTFVVPTLRHCEVDGRPVELVANGKVRHTSAVRVPTLELEVGESRVLAPEDLACIQLPGTASFVLTALNLTFAPDRYAGDNLQSIPVVLATFQTGPTPRDMTLAALPPALAAAMSAEEHAHLDLVRLLRPVDAHQLDTSTQPTPFDARYATAGMGDIVRFVSSWRLQAESATHGPACGRDRSQVFADSVRSYPARIAAISGDIVIAVDLRMPGAAEYLSGEGQRYLQRAADAAAPHLLATLRDVFAHDFTPMAGGGGRFYVVVTTPELHDPNRGGWGGIAGDLITEVPVSRCALSSEMHTVFISAGSFPPFGQWPGHLGSVIIHEFAHQADWLTVARLRLPGFAWVSPEAIAVVASETAMRMALNQERNARYDAILPNGLHEPYLTEYPWTGWRGLSPFRVGASYSTDAVFHLFMRELVGETTFAAEPNPLFQRLLRETSATPGFSYGSFRMAYEVYGRVLGMSTEELRDRFTLALVTDDLVEAAAARKQSLPQIESWDATSFKKSLPAGISRDQDVRVSLTTGASGFDAAYLWASPDRRGVSLEFTYVRPAPMILRITRLH